MLYFETHLFTYSLFVLSRRLRIMDISTDKDNADCIDLDLPELKAEILAKIYQCQQRGLTHSFKWLSEILYSLRKHGTLAATFPKVSLEQECEVYFLAKSYFDLKEYDRCAFFTGTQVGL